MRTRLAPTGLSLILGIGCTSQTLQTTTLSLSAEEVADLEGLWIDAEAGDLSVSGDPEATGIEVRARIGALLGPGQDPCFVTEGLSLSLARDTDAPTAGLRAHFEDEAAGVAWADLEVVLPSHLWVDLWDTSGDLHIRQVAGVSLVDTSGDVRLVQIGGEVRVDDTSGDLSLSDIAGDVEIVDTSGDIRVDGAGDVVIWDTSGDITVSQAASAEVREDTSGDVRIR